MAVRKEDIESVLIPLNQLKDSPKNVRKVPHSKAYIKRLAASLKAHGQLQNLIIEPELDGEQTTGHFLVNGGKARRLALLLLVKEKKIPVDHPVRCLLDTQHDARELSVAENVHNAMHPADEFDAFKAMIDEGKSIEDVAARFGVTPLVVQRRLKLANVCPDFIEMYRRDELTLEHMMALAVVDDHERQRKAWEALPKYNRNPNCLRDALTREEVSLTSPLARFVGDTYGKAGGQTRQDLFGKDDEGFIVDVELLNRLVAEKLAKAVARVKKEGFAWVESSPQLLHSDLSTFSRVGTILREPTEQENARLRELADETEKLQTEAEGLAEDDEERLQAIDERLDAIQEEEGAIEEAREEVDPAQKQVAGAMVTVDHAGKLRIERGLVRPEDKKRLAAQRKAQAGANGAPSTPPVERTHSAALLRRLTAHRTLALQATVANRPDIALVAVTHRLLSKTFFGLHAAQSSVQVEVHCTALEAYADDIKQAKARKALEERRASLAALLPKDAEALLPWLLSQPQSEVLTLLAFCVASTVHGVQGEEGPSPMDDLARAAGLDMREWWVPTAANYFGSLPKARLIAAVTEAASPEAAAPLSILKKADAAQLAEQRVAGTGWLPKVLRTVAA